MVTEDEQKATDFDITVTEDNRKATDVDRIVTEVVRIHA